MNGIFASLVVATGLVSATPEMIWHDDYAIALRDARVARRPLLIVLESPEDVDQRVEQVHFRPDPTQSELLEHYELCRIDVTTEYGKTIAAAFKATEFPHTAITDKAIKVLIFQKTGRFTTQQWVATLAAHSQGVAPAVEPPRRRICFT